MGNFPGNRVFAIAAIATFGFITGGQAAAAPGDVDRDFGHNGLVITKPDPPRETVVRDFVEAPDGKMLAVGGSGKVSESGLLVRYLPDGRLDRTFGGDGIVKTPSSLWARAVVGTDGRITTFGRIGHEPAIARFDDSGRPDTTFGQGGSVEVTGLRGLFQEPTKTLEFIGPGIDSQGRIVAAAIPESCVKDYYGRPGCPNTPVFRFTPDGLPDPAFGAGTGHVVLTAGPNPNYRPGLIALAPDDSLIIRSVPRHRINYGGYTSQDYRGVVQRFSADGAPDRSFGGDGSFEYGHSESNDGRIVAGPDGAITIFHDGVLKLGPDGTPVPGFGENGYREISGSGSGLGDPTTPTGWDLPGGGMLIAGTSGSNGKRLAVAVRLGPSSKRDPTYANDGVTARAIGDPFPPKLSERRRGLYFAGSIVHPDGSITVAATGRFEKQLAFTLTRFVGGRSDTRLECAGRPATVYGTRGDDRLFSGPGDVVAGLGGDDTITGQGLICAGSGEDDVALTGSGTAWAGAGNDEISGASKGKAFGQAGRDHFTRSGGFSYGGAGRDRIEGKGGTLEGGAGSDLLFTSGSRADGGPGDDRLIERGRDRWPDELIGGPGDDVIRAARQSTHRASGPGHARSAGRRPGRRPPGIHW